MIGQHELLWRAQCRADWLATLSPQIAAYAAGDVIGGPQIIGSNVSGGSVGPNSPFPEANLSAVLQSLIMTDPDGLSLDVDLFFFNQALSAGAATDKTVFAPAAADLPNLIGVLSLSHVNAKYLGNGSGAQAVESANNGLVLKPAANNGFVYMVPVVRSTPTFVSGKLYFRLQLSQGL
jgi:hypothetical protein